MTLIKHLIKIVTLLCVIKNSQTKFVIFNELRMMRNSVMKRDEVKSFAAKLEKERLN